MGSRCDDELAGQCRRMIVAGFGPVGRVVVDNLRAAGVRVTIVDLNKETIRTQSQLGEAIIFGDVSDRQTLETARIDRADALILTIPDEEAVVRACDVARRMAPKLFIAARVNHISSGMRARAAGADEVTVEELVTAETMQHAVIRHFLNDAKTDADRDCSLCP